MALSDFAGSLVVIINTLPHVSWKRRLRGEVCPFGLARRLKDVISQMGDYEMVPQSDSGTPGWLILNMLNRPQPFCTC